MSLRTKKLILSVEVAWYRFSVKKDHVLQLLLYGAYGTIGD